jgi:hypothetical protein
MSVYIQLLSIQGGFSAIMLAVIALTSDQLPTSQNSRSPHLHAHIYGSAASFGPSNAYNNDGSQVLFPAIPMSAPSSPRYTRPQHAGQTAATGQTATGQTLTGQTLTGQTTATGQTVTINAVPGANVGLAPASSSLLSSTTTDSGVQLQIPGSESLHRSTERVVTTRSIGELERQLSICKLLLRYGASVKLQNNVSEHIHLYVCYKLLELTSIVFIICLLRFLYDGKDGMDVIQVNRSRNIDAFGGIGGCMSFPESASTSTSAVTAGSMDSVCIAFELETVLVKVETTLLHSCCHT